MTRSLGALTRKPSRAGTEALQSSAARSKKQVFWQLLAMVPAALMMIADFTYLLARPIRDLDAVIHQFWRGKLAQRIPRGWAARHRTIGRAARLAAAAPHRAGDQRRAYPARLARVKTPLTALTEGSALLSDEVVGQLQCRAARRARILKVNSLTLERLIQDLLAYSQTQSAQRFDRKIAFDSAPVPVGT